jgi:acetylornithine deacetylase/succinyl-diaminopimelate desuccinylase-like protein
MGVGELLERVEGERLERLTLELVRIRSYTGESREAAAAYAARLREIGLEVELLYDFPEAPTVVARLRGAGGGPTLTLNGHLDTVAVAHPEPSVADGRVYGRGAADMKGGLAAMAEAARVLATSGRRLRGDLLLLAHGLHEAPDGHGQDIRELVRRGFAGNAAIIAEIASDVLPVIGLGLSIFDITFRRSGAPSHELLTPPGTPHPLLAAARLAGRMEARDAELARRPLPHVGSESYFLGILQGGDFFNRFPESCRLVGTRRYGPDTPFAEVETEIAGMARAVERETGAKAALSLTRVRDGFRVAESEPVLIALREAYREVTGRALPLVGSRMVGDAPIFIGEGGVPALYHGPGGAGAHADLESVPISELVRAAKVYIATAVQYLGSAD